MDCSKKMIAWPPLTSVALYSPQAHQEDSLRSHQRSQNLQIDGPKLGFIRASIFIILLARHPPRPKSANLDVGSLFPTSSQAFVAFSMQSIASGGMGLYTCPRCNAPTTKRRSDVDRGRVLSCGKSGCKGTHAQSGTTQYRYFQKLNDHSWPCFAEFWQDMGSSWPGPGAGLRKREVGESHSAENSYWVDNRPEPETPELVRRRNEFLKRKGRL